MRVTTVLRLASQHRKVLEALPGAVFLSHPNPEGSQEGTNTLKMVLGLAVTLQLFATACLYPNLKFVLTQGCSVAGASFLTCGCTGRLFGGSCCYHCARSETHTELEAVNLSPGLPVGINYSSRAVARMPNVFLWELCLAGDGT